MLVCGIQTKTCVLAAGFAPFDVRELPIDALRSLEFVCVSREAGIDQKATFDSRS